MRQIVLEIKAALYSCSVSHHLDGEIGPMSLGQTLSSFWQSIQGGLFPWLEEELGSLGERYWRFVTVLELARVESFLPHFDDLPSRPVEDRAALVRAFIAKAVFDVCPRRAVSIRGWPCAPSDVIILSVGRFVGLERGPPAIRPARAVIRPSSAIAGARVGGSAFGRQCGRGRRPARPGRGVDVVEFCGAD